MIDSPRAAAVYASRHQSSGAGLCPRGIIELALGFWAAGYYGRSAVLLVAWVAAFTLIRGVRDIVLAFRIRELTHAAPV